jgi:hypothetical protein
MSREMMRATPSHGLIGKVLSLSAPIPKLKWVQYRKQHGKAHARKFTDVEMAIKAVNTTKKSGLKKLTKKVDQESRRAAEPRGGTTILWVQ